MLHVGGQRDEFDSRYVLSISFFSKKRVKRLLAILFFMPIAKLLLYARVIFIFLQERSVVI